MTRARGERAFCFVAFGLCLFAHLWSSSIGWRHNLHELHEFRQIQTALTTRYIQEEGWSLAYPTPLFGPPWSVPLEFPIYQTCVAALSSVTGLPIEPTGRLVSLGFLYLSLPAFLLLLRQIGVRDHRRWLFLGLVLVTPLYLYYSRSFMIEATALCGGAWFLHAYCRALETRRWTWCLLALALGAAAALAKITTLLVFLVPAAGIAVRQLLAVRPTPDKRAWRPLLQQATLAAALAGFAVLIGLAWVMYSDAVKAANPLSRELVSSNMREWNYGTLALRLDANFWSKLLQHATTGVLEVFTAAALVVSTFFIGRAARVTVLLLIGCFVVAPLVFSNLYFLHDYYFYANAVFLLAAVAVVWNWLLDRSWMPAAGSWLIILATLGAQFFGFTNTYFGVQRRGDLPPPELGAALAGATVPGDVVLIYGLVWNPTLPYVAGRKAIMVTTKNEDNRAAQEEVFRRLPEHAVTALVLAGPLRNQHALREWLCQRFNLEPQPLLTAADANVYVARQRVGGAIARLGSVHFNTIKLNIPADTEYQGVALHRFHASELPDPSMVAMFSPRPVEILAPFGVSTADVDGAKALNAHAPTMVTIAVTPGARHLHATYGILPAAFAGPQMTDGVVFRIELVSPGGETAVVFERTLSPATVAEDRKQQTLDVDLPSASEGQLILRTLPGPANSITFDWAYWARVDIK